MTRIGIFGAGSVGCYLGGRLAAAGVPVTLVGRERLLRITAEHGLTTTDYQGHHAHVRPDEFRFSTRAADLADADVVLVTVKSAATADAGRALAEVLPAGTPVVSFQNGIHNAATLQALLPDQPVFAGMVPFNVLDRGQGGFHQGSAGALELARDTRLMPLVAELAAAGLAPVCHADMPAVLWGKLLLNLNNPVNALSGLSLREELSQRSFRRCLALAQREALAVMSAAGIRPARVTAVPPSWLPRVMDVPDALFRRLASRMLAIDPLARSSMWEDLEAGRRTEIDWINGEVVAQAARLGMPVPVNARLVALIRDAEAGGRRDWSGPALLAELTATRS